MPQLFRGFQEVTVSSLEPQAGADRWPLHEDDFPPRPDMSEFAMNLTVLSQVHNLYFVACRADVHVYKPVGSNNILSAAPQFLLQLPLSDESLVVGPQMTGLVGHDVTHLVVGFLGEQEILLCACNDGDVLAYFTDALWRAVEDSSKSALEFPAEEKVTCRPFFHENVGASAWGLAIHQQSRMVAVSSNNHEVQVFVFALRNSDGNTLDTQQDGPYQTDPWPTELPKVQFPILYSTSGCPVGLDGCVEVSRATSFRIVLKNAQMTDNIPSIAFSSDKNGEAETILATDIEGTLWFYGIWTLAYKGICSVPTSQVGMNIVEGPHGWGVIVLPREFFKRTYSDRETWGVKQSWVLRKGRFDVSCSVAMVKDHQLRHDLLRTPWRCFFTREGYETDDELSDEEDWFMRPGTVVEGASPRWTEAEALIRSPSQHQEKYSHKHSAKRLAYPPSILRLPSVSKLPILTLDRSINTLVSNGAVVLHINRHDVHLLPSAPNAPPTLFSNILRQEVTHEAQTANHPIHDHDIASYYNCLKFLHTIPELSLVLIGSQVGRVALCTITRPMHADARVKEAVSMRLDYVLPFATEEQAGMRPRGHLLGLAVSEVERGRKGNGRHGREWRVLLHYNNGTVLSYTLSRDEEYGLAEVQSRDTSRVSFWRRADQVFGW